MNRISADVIGTVDPVAVEVIGSALSTIVEEMAKAIIHAAYSTNIKERQDTSTALFDAQGRTIAQAERIPIHLGSLLGIAEHVFRHHDLATVRPGDGLAGNDAHIGGGTHLNDIVLMEPVFHGDAGRSGYPCQLRFPPPDPCHGATGIGGERAAAGCRL